MSDLPGAQEAYIPSQLIFPPVGSDAETALKDWTREEPVILQGLPQYDKKRTIEGESVAIYSRHALDGINFTVTKFHEQTGKTSHTKAECLAHRVEKYVFDPNNPQHKHYKPFGMFPNTFLQNNDIVEYAFYGALPEEGANTENVDPMDYANCLVSRINRKSKDHLGQDKWSVYVRIQNLDNGSVENFVTNYTKKQRMGEEYEAKTHVLGRDWEVAFGNAQERLKLNQYYEESGLTKPFPNPHEVNSDEVTPPVFEDISTETSGDDDDDDDDEVDTQADVLESKSRFFDFLDNRRVPASLQTKMKELVADGTIDPASNPICRVITTDLSVHIIVQTDTKTLNGSFAHNFHVIADSREDKPVAYAHLFKVGVELAHITNPDETKVETNPFSRLFRTSSQELPIVNIVSTPEKKLVLGIHFRQMNINSMDGTAWFPENMKKVEPNAPSDPIKKPGEEEPDREVKPLSSFLGEGEVNIPGIDGLERMYIGERIFIENLANVANRHPELTGLTAKELQIYFHLHRYAQASGIELNYEDVAPQLAVIRKNNIQDWTQVPYDVFQSMYVSIIRTSLETDPDFKGVEISDELLSRYISYAELHAGVHNVNTSLTEYNSHFKCHDIKKHFRASLG